MKLLDRLAGDEPARRARPTGALSPWRYLADCRVTTEPSVTVSVGPRPVDGDVVALTVALRTPCVLRVRDSGGLNATTVEIATPCPPGVDQEEDLRACLHAGGSLELFPLRPPAPEFPTLGCLLRLLEEKADPIAGICRNPQLNLRLEERAEPLRRARRMTLRSAPHLALHPEDWEGRTVRMPIPRRLLTSIPADDFITYENRLVRSVVEDAGFEASRQATIIARAIAKIERANALSQGKLGGDWARVRRVCELLVLPPQDQVEKDLHDLREQLTRLRRIEGTLDGARQSVLFRELRAAPHEREVRPTNLLVHDSKYRAARDVRVRLNALHRQRDNAPITDRLVDYFEWVRVALDRAFDQLGWARTSVAAATREGRGWRVELQVEQTLRRVLLKFARKELRPLNGPQGLPLAASRAPRPQSSGALLLLPVWSALGDLEARGQALAEIDRAAPSPYRVICVYPGGGDDGDGDGAGPSPLWRHRIVAASPALLDSVEVLSREILRETWLRDLLDDVPISYCPSCPNDFDDGRQIYRCDECETRWSVQACRQCAGAVPVPWLSAPGQASSGGELRRRRTDLTVTDGEGRRLCPGCGQPA